MKKAKFLIYAALAASTVAISSCSDNDVLSEPANEPEGKALIVNPTVEGSRITPLTKSAFTGFKLYGIQNPTNDETVGSFIKTGGVSGVNYAGTFGSSDAEVAFAPASGTVKWPTTNPDNSANFYGISVQGGADLAESGITVTEDGITEGTFSYSAPMSGGYVDLSKQKDIMIASSLDAKQSTDNGVVTLPFKHAFAKLTLQVRWNSDEIVLGKSTPTGPIEEDAVLWVDYIKIHNVKCNGTYSFTADDGNGGKGKWTVDGENSTIMFQYDTPRRFDAGKNPTTEIPFEVQDLMTGTNSVMIIPQTLGLWQKGTSDNFSVNTEDAFIEMYALGYNVTDAKSDYPDSWETYVANTSFATDALKPMPSFSLVVGEDNTSTNYFSSVYFPIRKDSSTAFEFESNKSYNFRLNMVTCRADDGEAAIDGVTITD